MFSVARADDSTTTIADGFSIDNATADFQVGQTGASNLLQVINGGQLGNVANGYVGNGSNAFHNTVLISDPGSAWNMQESFYLGFFGPSNSMTIANGGVVQNTSGYLGGAARRQFQYNAGNRC